MGGGVGGIVGYQELIQALQFQPCWSDEALFGLQSGSNGAGGSWSE